MTQIIGQYDVNLNINGADVPFPPTNCSILHNESVMVALPSTRIEVFDTTSVFDRELPVNDGTVINLRIGDGQNAATETRFRVFGTPKRKPIGEMVLYQIHGILDAIPYIRANPAKAFKGSSLEVMQQIGRAMDFKLVANMSTNDIMTWMPGRKTWNGFAELLNAHSWVDEKSAMHIGVTSDRELHFKNITELFANTPIKAELCFGQKPQSQNNVKQIVVDEYKAENHSGIQNNLAGYGLRLAQSNVLTGAVQKFLNVKAMTVNNVIDISRDVLGQIGARGRIDIPRINTGNSFPQFMQAFHQNTRIRSTYSQNVYVLVSVGSGLKLFDMVKLSIKTAQGTDDSVAGLYSVTSITKAFKNQRYKEKIQLTSAGPQNANPGLI